MFDFDNVEKKLKLLAKINLTIGIVIACIQLIVLFVLALTTFKGLFLLIGIIDLIVILLVFYITSLFIYGFGQLIENTKKE